ncbi:hypothetical protein PQX77_014822 [Marasmius sp. AFHP31]|nr:hypothetical protein PQX77_014822 [Marasmius sp. AFHP31]
MTSILPWEILASIFELSRSSHTIDNRDLKLGEYNVPSIRKSKKLPFEVQLSHVSQRWREISLGTSTLWTNIFVQRYTSPEAVSAYLQRSSGGPLNVILIRGTLDDKDSDNSDDDDDDSGYDSDDDSDDDDEEKSQALQKTFDLVLLHITRWRRCWIHSSLHSIDSPFLTRLVSVRAPALEYLSIGVEVSDHMRPKQSDSFSTPQIFTGGCPRLTSLYLRGLSVYLFRPPMSVVTTLSVELTRQIRIHLPELRALLHASPLLLHLSISGDAVGNQFWPPSSPITTPALRTLVISSVRASNYSSILLTVEAPQLVKIILKDAMENDLDPFFNSPHTYKFPLIHSLIFCDSQFTVPKYRMFFESFPSVSELAFLGKSESQHILRSISDTAYLTPGLHTNSLWPRLKALNVDLKFDSDTKGLLLKDGLEGRLTAGYGPEKLTLGVTADADSLEEVNPLVVACDDPEWLQKHVSVEVMEGPDLWRRCCC